MKSATIKDSDKPSKGKDSSNFFAFKDKTIVVKKSNFPENKDKRKEKKLSYSGTLLIQPSFLKDFPFYMFYKKHNTLMLDLLYFN